MSSAFVLENVSVVYGKTKALKDISLEIEENCITSILGVNGSGKSTLLKALSSFLPLQTGKITVFDKSNLTRKEKAHLISYLPQYRSIPDCTVEQLLLYGRFPHKSFLHSYSQADKDFVANIIEENSLSPFAKTALSCLSGGQRQKAYIAMALCQEAKIMLLDEPLTFLDIKQQFEILSLLRSIATTKARSVVMVSHNLDLSLTLSDRIILLDSGSLVYSGTPDKATAYIDSIFGVKTHKVELPNQSSHYVFTAIG